MRDYATAAVACIATTAIAAPLSRDLDLANVVMLYPLTVLLVALRLGRGPAVLAAFLSVALFDFFLVPPYYTFAVADIQYVLTFAVMLIVALITGHLTAGLRQQGTHLARREERTRALYEMARELVAAHTMVQLDEIVRSFVSKVASAQAVMLLRDQRGELQAVADGGLPSPIDKQMAQLACADTGFTDMDSARPVRYYPMKTAERLYGVLAFVAQDVSMHQLGEHGELLEAVASLAAISVERVQYVDAASQRWSEPLAQRLAQAYSSLLSEQLAGTVNSIDALVKALQIAELEGLLPKESAGVSAELVRSVVPLRSTISRIAVATSSSGQTDTKATRTP